MEVGTQIGSYLIVGRLGRGGMGEVYRARDTVLDREVAIKTLPPSVRGDRARLSRFEREARLLASLNHPNIATLHGLAQEGEERCLVMELVEGTPLEQLLRAGPLPPPEAVRIARQIAEALEAAHEKGIVHRDLKPSNVMVSPKGRVKVLDFGIAKSIDPATTVLPDEAATAGASLTAAGMVLGTPPYMSPEQARGQTVDERTDIWAFGCLLYEMLTGGRAYGGDTWVDTLSAILTREPDWRALPPDIPGSLHGLLEQCLAKDWDRRASSIAAVRDELERMYDDRSRSLLRSAEPTTIVEVPRTTQAPTPVLQAPPTLPPPTLSPPTPPPAAPSRRRAWIAAAVALAVLLSSGGLLVLPEVRDLLGRSHADAPSKVTSLVVLPGRVLGGEADLFLADAVPNTVSTHLAQIEGLETKVPPSNLEFERAGRDLQRIADAYRVGAVVLPTVTVAGDRLILNLQLVEIPSRVVLWTRDFEDRRDRYVELARAAAEGIRLALRPTAPALPRPANVARNSEAELALHQGRFLASLYRRNGLAEDFERALAALQRVLELDPRQAEAPAEIARLHAARIVTGVPPQELVPEVRKWARRALEIDPRSSQAWAVLSEAEQIDPERSYEKMLDYALKAAAFGPDDGYAHNRLSYALSRHSVLLGLEASKRARQLDPLDLSPLVADAIVLSAISRVDEALSCLEQVLRVEPDMPFALLMKALVETLAGHGDAAVDLVARLEPVARDGRLRSDWLALVRDYATFEKAARQGNREPADAAAGRLLRTARGETKFPRWESATTPVAPLLARHGRSEEALELLSFRDRLGLVETYELFILNQDLEPLRGDPRFQTVLERSRKQFDEMLGILSAARDRGEYPAYLDPALDELLPLVGIPRPW